VQHYFDNRLKIAAINSEKPEKEMPEKNLNAAVAKYEKELIIKALKASDGNVSMAARNLGLPKQTMHNKIKKHKIKLMTEIR
jgi:arginine utilization regulatory protein